VVGVAGLAGVRARVRAGVRAAVADFEANFCALPRKIFLASMGNNFLCLGRSLVYLSSTVQRYE